MIHLTMIARAADGLPLAASMQEDEQMKSEKTGRNLVEYQSQAKQLCRKLSSNSPSRSTIETGPYLFHYLLEHGVCYLILVEKSFSKKSAFAYLEEIKSEFHAQYGHKMGTVSRPYTFIEFDTYIQRTKKMYTDSRASRNLNQLNVELQDVQRIMVQNIDDVLQRGESLSNLDDRATNLSSISKKYRSDASYLNLKSAYAKYIVLCIFILIVFTYLYYKFLW